MNKEYTWVEMPVDAFINGNLSKTELILLSELCLRVDEDGFIHDLALSKVIAHYDKNEWKNSLNKLYDNKIWFYGPKSGEPKNYQGRYVNFSDDIQCEKIFGRESISASLKEEEKRITRMQFPIELLYDTKLDRNDILFLSLCYTYSHDKKTVDGDVLLGGLIYCKFPKQEVKDKLFKLTRLKYIRPSEDFKIFELLPEQDG